MLFTDLDRCIWRNVASWSSDFLKGEWLQLPGPAWLWPDDYDLESHGFEPETDAEAAETLYRMVYANSIVAPPRSDRVLLSFSEFRWAGLFESQPYEEDFEEIEWVSKRVYG